MVDKRDLPPRMRLACLFASVLAVVALAVTVLADNHNVGFGHTITRGAQMFLLGIASLLLAAQTIAYLVQYARRPTKHRTDRTTTAVPGAKE